MRNLISLSTVFSVLCTVFTLSSQPALATKVIGNGGDTYSLEFVMLAKDISVYLRSLDNNTLDLNQLDQAIQTTQVESTYKNLSLNNIPKDAINYPLEKRIIFNINQWLNTKEGLKPRLVLHEYLGILNKNDSNYSLSTSLLKDFGYQKNTIEVDGLFTVNFATSTQFSLNAHVTIENFGPQSWQYNSSEEKLRLVIALKDQRKVFLIPTTGRLISAVSMTDGEDDGIILSILQPIYNKNKAPRLLKEKGNEYIIHVIREYRIELKGTKGKLPSDAEFSGPISNTAG